jgi:hypothetical protein
VALEWNGWRVADLRLKQYKNSTAFYLSDYQSYEKLNNAKIIDIYV